MNIEIKNESKSYKMTKGDLFIIEELYKKKKLGLFNSLVFKLNEKVHIDFLDFNSKIITICDNKL
jgi:hypothetical protein